MIERFKPAQGQCHVDNDYGRVSIHYPGFTRKSISWTKRGMKKAALLALNQFWSWHTRATGVEPPRELAEMMAE